MGESRTCLHSKRRSDRNWRPCENKLPKSWKRSLPRSESAVRRQNLQQKKNVSPADELKTADLEVTRDIPTRKSVSESDSFLLRKANQFTATGG